MTKKLCPNCEELLKPTSNPEVGQCSGCGWSGHYWRAASEPALLANPPKMHYVSIDIETTGLDVESCQILEIGAVWDDWTKPIDQLPSYHRLVVHKEYRGNAYALALNANLLRRLSGEREPWFRDPDQVADDFAAWLKGCGMDPKVAHTALEDALAVVRLVRMGVKRLRTRWPLYPLEKTHDHD